MATVFWETFTEACKARGTTPSGVAKALGLSSGSPTAWKRGATPNAFTIAEISRFLDWNMERFYGTTDDLQEFLDKQGQKENQPTGIGELSEEEIQLVNAFRRIAEDDKGTYLRIVVQGGEQTP